jgi:nucleoside-diphosphate-sugar epimerase
MPRPSSAGSWSLLKTAFPSAAAVVEDDLRSIAVRLADVFPALEGKSVLITGGGGFLGYYLVQSLLHWNAAADPSEPIRLTVWENFARGVPRWLEELAGTPELIVREHDVVAPPPAGEPAHHYVVHAAGIASPTYYRRHPIETMDANVVGLRNLLDRCVRDADGLEGFLFFSSSEIYGDPAPEAIPTPETYRGNVSCTGPRACYDESKRYGETLCVNFARQHGLPITIARPFNNYGPGLKLTDRRVIPDFARDVLAGRDIVMLSDGAATRTFCYVADAVVGYYRTLVRGRPGESYNVGVEAPEISMLDLARRVADHGRSLFGYRGRVTHRSSADGDYLVDNPSRRCPIIDKARTELGYEPVVTLDDGIERTLVWYAEHGEGADA